MDNLQMHEMGTVTTVQFRTTCGLCDKHPALFEYEDLYILLLLVFLIGGQLMALPGIGRRRRATERFSMTPWTYSRYRELAPVSARLVSLLLLIRTNATIFDCMGNCETNLAQNLRIVQIMWMPEEEVQVWHWRD